MNTTRFGKKTQICFKKVLPAKDRTFFVTNEMILLLGLIDESKDIEQIVKEAGLAPNIFRKSLTKLMKEGLIKPFEGSKKYLSQQDFVLPLKKSMRNAAGPIADYYIEEVVSEMGFTMDAIPQEKASQLIYNLSNAIQDSEARGIFCEDMLSLIPEGSEG